MTEQVQHPDPERLWDRRWTSHRWSLALTAAYIVAIVVAESPWMALWPLVALNSMHYGPAMLEALSGLRRP